MDGKGRLCLSRVVGESVVIYDAVGNVVATVTVGKVQGGHVSLVFVADKSIRFMRGELVEEDRPTEG